jgi:hypothetical protein
MRVINDREEKSEPSELGVLQVFSYALFCAAGISTVVFCPVPMILAHLRLSDMQAKLSGLLGALIALTFLEIPMNVVVLTFIFGLFVGDGVAKQRPFWKQLSGVGVLALVSAFGMLAVQAAGEQMALLPYWHDLVHSAIDQLQKGVQSSGGLDWAQLESLLFYEGPFLFGSVALLSFWFSVGLIAHLGGFPDGHVYGGDGLRDRRLSGWIIASFAIFFFGTFFGPEWSQRIASGLVRLTGSLLFIQGCMTLSQVLKKRNARPRTRTLVYSFSVVFAFYALVVVGLLSPWIGKLGSWRRTSRALLREPAAEV